MSFLTKAISFSLLTFSATSLAESFPRGCEVTGFGYNNYNLEINDSGQQGFYLLQNRSNTIIEMQRVESKDAFLTPSLTARIQAANWAAFASDVAHLQFQCFVVDNEKSERVNCRDVLDICQYPRAKFALSNMGNYWVSINKTQHQVINDSAAKGIYLRW